MTLIEKSAPDIRRKLQYLDRVSGMNPSQPLNIAFKVYHAWEIRKLKQATVFLETVRRDQKDRCVPKGRRKDSLGANQ